MASESTSNMRPQIEKLNGQNYVSWKFNMKCLLMERGLWGYVNGNIVEPKVLKSEDGSDDTKVAASVEKFNEYNLKADKAYSLIALSVEKHLQIHVSTEKKPKEAWDSLSNQFNFVSVNQMVRLNQRFFRAKMVEGGDLLKHITEMTNLAEQLKEMDDEISSKKFAVAVLGSLPESYDNFLTSLNSRGADTLDWNSIRGALMEEYHKRKEKEKHRADDEALFTNRFEHSSHDGYRNRGSNNSNRGGFHNRGGSNSNRGGFSSRGGFSNRGGTRGNFRGQRRHPYQFTGTCYKCDELGHRANVCPRNNIGGGQEEASVAETIFHEDDIALIVFDEEERLIEEEEDSHLFYSSMSMEENNAIEQQDISFEEEETIFHEEDSDDSHLFYSSFSMEENVAAEQQVISFVPHILDGSESKDADTTSSCDDEEEQDSSECCELESDSLFVSKPREMDVEAAELSFFLSLFLLLIDGVASDEHETDENDGCEIVCMATSENSVQKDISHEWCVDSGASKHMTNDESILSNVTYYDEPTPVYLGDKSTVLSHGEGQLRLQTMCENGTCLSRAECCFGKTE